MGRELFDYAFKTYSERWAFKHPTPADFFRTMEDASAVDLDWFWRGWFYTNDHVDISLDQVNWFKVNSGNPDVENPIAKEKSINDDTYIGYERNIKSIPKTMTEIDSQYVDFYTTHDPFKTNILDREEYQSYLDNLDDEEIEILSSDKNYYEIQFSNIGGLVMPIILQFEFTDGTNDVIRIPAEIWKKNSDRVKKVFILDKEISNITLDPFLETADVNVNNNYWPPKNEPTRFQLFKQKSFKSENPMQRDRRSKIREKELEN